MNRAVVACGAGRCSPHVRLAMAHREAGIGSCISYEVGFRRSSRPTFVTGF